MSKDKKTKIDYATEIGAVITVKKDERAIMLDLLEKTFDNYRKNKIDEEYFQGIFDSGIAKESSGAVLAATRNEIGNQEMYMEYLLKKLKG